MRLALSVTDGMGSDEYTQTLTGPSCGAQEGKTKRKVVSLWKFPDSLDLEMREIYSDSSSSYMEPSSGLSHLIVGTGWHPVQWLDLADWSAVRDSTASNRIIGRGYECFIGRSILN